MMTKHDRQISDARALQISNNVAEEYNDHGQTNFATKDELCRTILWLNNHHAQHLQRKDLALDEMIITAFKARTYSSG